MAASDLELGYAGAKVYSAFGDGARFCVLLFDARTPELHAVIDADALGRLRTGAASGVAAKCLAKPEAASLGVIGCGWQARGQVDAIRAAVPGIEPSSPAADARAPEGVLPGDRCRGGRGRPGRGRAGRGRHRYDLSRPGAARRVAQSRRARLRRRRQRRPLP